jgi:hypothetical protein
MLLGSREGDWFRPGQEVNANVANDILTALSGLNQHAVLHHDVKPRNVLSTINALGYV